MVIKNERKFQSTLPVRGGTGTDFCGYVSSVISIHPPRMGRDDQKGYDAGAAYRISIHPSCVGRDQRVAIS